jgi:hypothetical protein
MDENSKLKIKIVEFEKLNSNLYSIEPKNTNFKLPNHNSENLKKKLRA